MKLNVDGSIKRYKARLVAKGFTQKFEEDFDEVFAPLVKQTFFRTLSPIAPAKKMIVTHIDDKNVFLNCFLEHDIYMKQPECFVVEGKENNDCL